MIVYQPARSGVPTVVACSPPAWALGVRDGMPLAEATGLAGLSEALADHLIHHGDKLHGVCCARLSEPLADRRSLEGLAAWCQQFSPWVGLEDVRCDGDMAGCRCGDEGGDHVVSIEDLAVIRHGIHSMGRGHPFA